jgi:hypothetical protein
MLYLKFTQVSLQPLPDKFVFLSRISGSIKI